MGYALYLVGCVLLAALAAMANPFSSSFQLVSANLCNLVDLPTLAWVLAVCAPSDVGSGPPSGVGFSPPIKFGRAFPPGSWYPWPPFWPADWAFSTTCLP